MKEILSSISVSNDVHIFFKEAHVKEAIRDLNKNSSPVPDKITPESIQNEGKKSYYMYLIARLLSFRVFSQILETRQQNTHEKTRQR